MNIDELPKSLKKAVRYIKQDASLSQLKQIEKHLQYAINKRLNDLDRQPNNQKAM